MESGKTAQRPGFQAALAQAKANANAATLVIAKLDRLSRNVAFIAALLESNVRVVAADMPEANTLTLHVMAAFAQHEREAISQRTKAALVAAIRGADENIWNGIWEVAPHAADFLDWAMSNFDPIWLTARDRDGNGKGVITAFDTAIGGNERLTALASRIRSQAWEGAKTTAMDFSRPFLWLDDCPRTIDLLTLEAHGCVDQWIEVNTDLRPDDLLIRLGFLDLFKPSKRGQRIFPELLPTGRLKKFGDTYSSHFTDYRRKCGLYERLRDYHSFRRTFITMIRTKAGVDPLTVAAMAGHDDEWPELVRVKQTNDYTDYSISVLKDAIERLDYEGLGLDVSPLLTR